MKVYKGSGGTDPLNLSLGDRWRLVVNITLRPAPQYSSNRRLYGPQGRSSRCEEKKNVSPLSGVEFRTAQPVA
jgi:hypothetical protein